MSSNYNPYGCNFRITDIPVGSEYIGLQGYLYWNVLIFVIIGVNRLRKYAVLVLLVRIGVRRHVLPLLYYSIYISIYYL